MTTRVAGATPLLLSVAVHAAACAVVAPWVAARESAVPTPLVPIQLVSITEPAAPPPPLPPPPVIKRPPPRREPIVAPKLISRPEIEEPATPPPPPTPIPEPTPVVPPEPTPAPAVAAAPPPPAPPAVGEGAGARGGGIAPPRGDGGGIALPVGDGGGTGKEGIGAGGRGAGMLASTGSATGLTSFARPRGGYQTRPKYPESARRAGIEGITTLRFEVRADGSVGTMTVEKSTGSHDLDQAAMTAVRTWRFDPARRGTEAVAVWVTLPVRFELNAR
jgi:protein TonB